MKVDIWSSGITLYAMLCGSLPFDEESKTALYEKILSCKYTIPKHLSPEAADLLKRLLVRDVNKRAQIEDIMKHPWMQKYLPIKNGKVIPTETFQIEDDICRLSAYKLKEEPENLRKMLENNEHNKCTTLYYLLVQKNQRGELELEKELEEFAEAELKRERSRRRREARSNSRDDKFKDQSYTSQQPTLAPVPKSRSRDSYERAYEEENKKLQNRHEREQIRDRLRERPQSREVTQEDESSFKPRKSVVKPEPQGYSTSHYYRKASPSFNRGTASRDGSRPEKGTSEENRSVNSRKPMAQLPLQQTSYEKRATVTHESRSPKKTVISNPNHTVQM